MWRCHSFSWDPSSEGWQIKNIFNLENSDRFYWALQGCYQGEKQRTWRESRKIIETVCWKHYQKHARRALWRIMWCQVWCYKGSYRWRYWESNQKPSRWFNSWFPFNPCLLISFNTATTEIEVASNRSPKQYLHLIKKTSRITNYLGFQKSSCNHGWNDQSDW